MSELASSSLAFRLCVCHAMLHDLRTLVWRLETSDVRLGIL